MNKTLTTLCATLSMTAVMACDIPKMEVGKYASGTNIELQDKYVLTGPIYFKGNVTESSRLPNNTYKSKIETASGNYWIITPENLLGTELYIPVPIQSKEKPKEKKTPNLLEDPLFIKNKPSLINPF